MTNLHYEIIDYMIIAFVVRNVNSILPTQTYHIKILRIKNNVASNQTLH